MNHKCRQETASPALEIFKNTSTEHILKEWMSFGKCCSVVYMTRQGKPKCDGGTSCEEVSWRQEASPMLWPPS